MADKNLTSGITAASALDGTELVHVVQSGNSRKATAQNIVDLMALQSDTVTLSGSSTDWSIPSGVTEVHIHLADGALSGTVNNPQILLLKASDSTAGAFDNTAAFDKPVTATTAPNNATVTTGQATADTYFGIVAENATGLFGIWANIFFPRSSSIETRGDWAMLVGANDKMRRGASVAVTAEDHDTIRFNGATTMSGTVYITYR